MNNDVFPNKFKAALAAKQVQIGCWSALSNPISTEVLGLAGFDWLVLDGEHAPNDISTFIPQLMALKGSASAPVVRVPTNEPVIIKRLLDIGFYNFLIPFVETKEEAEQAVASTRYPPEGIRGVSVSHRANMFGTVADYFAQSNKNITILVQIERQHGYDDVALFSDRFSRRRCFCTCSNHVSNSFWVTVSNHQRVTCFQKVFTHWFTHNPQANKTNFHSHINHLSCCGGGYFLKVSASF